MIGPVCLTTREARFALRMAEWMVTHAKQSRARSESVRLRNTLREALDGVVDRQRAQERARRAAYRTEDWEKLRTYNRLASRRRRARLRERQGAA